MNFQLINNHYQKGTHSKRPGLISISLASNFIAIVYISIHLPEISLDTLQGELNTRGLLLTITIENDLVC